MVAPEIVSIKTAILTYYNKKELRNNDIERLFGGMSNTRLYKLKQAAKAVEQEEGVKKWNKCAVNTGAAYKAWGIDVAELERRLLKIQKLGLEDVG